MLKILQKTLLAVTLLALPVAGFAANELGQTNKFLTNAADDLLNMDMNNDVLTNRPAGIPDETWSKINQYIIDYEGNESLFQDAIKKAQAERKEKGFVNQDFLETVVNYSAKSSEAIVAFAKALMKYNLQITNTSKALEKSATRIEFGYTAYVTWGEDYYNYLNYVTEMEKGIVKYNAEVDKGSVSPETKKSLLDIAKKGLELGTILADYVGKSGIIPKIEAATRAQNAQFAEVVKALEK